MCVAIGKLKGRELPTRSELENCWDKNPHGAGFSYNWKGKVYTKKGFMTFKSFMEALEYWDRKVNLKNCGVLMHFRIATHGARDASMTHPFPVVNDDSVLKKVEFVSSFALAHNGIIDATKSKATKSDGLSDTAIFVRDYVFPLSQNRGWFYRKSNIDLIYTMGDSKFIILNSNGDIVKTPGFQEHNGVFYSNSSYEKYWSRGGTVRYGNGGVYHYPSTVYVNKYYDYTGQEWDDGYPATAQEVRAWAKNNPATTQAETETSGVVKAAKESSSADKAKYGVVLMRCEVGDTVECDSLTDEISYTNRDYYIDEWGQIFFADNSNTKHLYDLTFQYVGEGTFFDRNIQEKEFKANSANSVFVYYRQFESEYGIPDYIFDDGEPDEIDETGFEVTATTITGETADIVEDAQGDSDPATESNDESSKTGEVKALAKVVLV
jgi:hypothetical protein